MIFFWIFFVIGLLLFVAGGVGYIITGNRSLTVHMIEIALCILVVAGIFLAIGIIKQKY